MTDRNSVIAWLVETELRVKCCPVAPLPLPVPLPLPSRALVLNPFLPAFAPRTDSLAHRPMAASA